MTYGQYTEDKPKDCRYCYFWGGKKKGCMLDSCYYQRKDYIDEIHDSMPEGEEVLRLSGRYDESVDPGYGYGNDDLVLQIEEVE